MFKYTVRLNKNHEKHLINRVFELPELPPSEKVNCLAGSNQAHHFMFKIVTIKSDEEKHTHGHNMKGHIVIPVIDSRNSACVLVSVTNSSL